MYRDMYMMRHGTTWMNWNVMGGMGMCSDVLGYGNNLAVFEIKAAPCTLCAVTGQLPLGQLPLGQLPWGQLPRGQLPHRAITPLGQLPPGQLPPRQLPPRTITPVGQLPRGQLPLLVGQLPPRTITPLILISG